VPTGLATGLATSLATGLAGLGTWRFPPASPAWTGPPCRLPRNRRPGTVIC